MSIEPAIREAVGLKPDTINTLKIAGDKISLLSVNGYTCKSSRTRTINSIELTSQSDQQCRKLKSEEEYVYRSCGSCLTAFQQQNVAGLALVFQIGLRCMNIPTPKKREVSQWNE